MVRWIQVLELAFLPIGLGSGQVVPDNENYVDDLSFLDVALDRGENARLCV